MAERVPDYLETSVRDDLVVDERPEAPPTPPRPRPSVIEEPLWKIRLRLLWRGLRSSWGMFAENKIGLLGLGIIVFFALMAIAHPILMNTVWTPRVYDPVIGYDAPLVQLEVVETVTDPTSQIDLFTARLDADPLAQIGDIVEVSRQPAPPSRQHLLGTDPLGRDILSQLMFSTRSAFALGAIAAIVTALIATTVGAIAAYYGGWIDSALMRLADLILLLPALAVLIVVSVLFTINLPMLGILVGVFSGFGATAIVLKSQALAIKVKPFIDAAKVAGGGNMHVIFRHIVPNVMPLSFLYMMFEVTTAISLEAVLSFFGLLNVNMSWGLMLNVASSQGYLLTGTQFWWLLLPAGAAVTLLAAAFFLVGRAMDEVINPRLRKR